MEIRKRDPSGSSTKTNFQIPTHVGKMYMHKSYTVNARYAQKYTSSPEVNKTSSGMLLHYTYVQPLETRTDSDKKLQLIDHQRAKYTGNLYYCHYTGLTETHLY